MGLPFQIAASYVLPFLNDAGIISKDHVEKNCIWKLETLFLIIMQIRYRLDTSCKHKCYQTRGFRRPIGLLLTSAPRLSKPYRYFATFVLLLTYLPRNVLEIGRLCEKLSISCQFRGILNFFNVNEQINHKLIGLRRHIEPSKSFESDYPQLPEVGQSIVFPPIWVIFG